MKREHWSRKLDPMGACDDAVVWARTQPSFAAAWKECQRGDYMLWLLGRLVVVPSILTHRRVVNAAASCARVVLPIWKKTYPNDDRPRLAILAAEQWAQTPTRKNKQVAADTGHAVARALHDITKIAADAEYAAHSATYAAYAVADIVQAADSATYAANAIAASAVKAKTTPATAARIVRKRFLTRSAARKRSLARAAAIVRSIVPCPRLLRGRGTPHDA